MKERFTTGQEDCLLFLLKRSTRDGECFWKEMDLMFVGSMSAPSLARRGYLETKTTRRNAKRFGRSRRGVKERWYRLTPKGMAAAEGLRRNEQRT